MEQSINIDNFYIFSPNITIIEKLIQIGNVRYIAIEKKHLSQDLINLSKLWNIPLYYSNTLSEIDYLFSDIKENSIGISFGTGFIFKDYHINTFKYGIMNIHPGQLPENRGRHPIAWSFFNCDKFFYLTSHLINDKIDQGTKIFETKIFRSINDTTESILKKIDFELSNNFIPQSLNNLFSKNKEILKQGNYFPAANQVFNNISTDDFTAKQIYSIFKSQKIYCEVTVNGVKYKNCDFYNENLTYNGHYDIITIQNEKIILYK